MMDHHLLTRVFLLVLSMSSTMVTAQVKSFPKMSEMFIEFYQTEVVLTVEDRDFSAFATEYYDGSQGISVLKLLVIGDRMSYYYYNYTNDILEVNGTACTASSVDESVEYYDPPFYGWVNRKPFVIGPSALLWFAQNMKVDYIGPKTVRGIRCDHFGIDVDGKDDKIEINYYIAADDWTTPYKLMNLKVPIRIEVNGVSARTTLGHMFDDVNHAIDFTYFKSIIDDWRELQPPYGIGCFGRKTKDMIMPKLPQAFKYSVQIHDMLKESEPDAITYERVYFDNTTNMARIDQWSRKKRAASVYDFQNGVSYNVQTDYTCSIKAIRKSLFVRDDGHLMTLIKSPQQILGLTGDFYFMGYIIYRGIPCSVFETAKRFAYYQEKLFYLLVVTVFYTQDYTEVVTDGEDLMDSPVYVRVTGYNAFNNMTFQRQFNIFGFDDVSGETIYQNFPIESCFPRLEDRAYFVLIIKPKKEDITKFSNDIAKPLERNNALFLQGIREELVKNLKISDIRVPFLKADYFDSGIYVTGLMLERPPYLSQFWLYPLNRVPLGSGLILRENVNTLEDCARTCIEESFLCRGFHFCGKYSCLTASKPMDNDTVVPNKEQHDCKIYFRGYGKSSTAQPYLADVVEMLEEAVDKKTLNVSVPIDPFSKNNDEVNVRFTDIVFGEGPFTKTNSDKNYKMVAENYQIISQTYVETTVDEAGYDTITDCYQACKDDKSLSCASFSICPNAKVKDCRISSQVVINPDSAVDNLEEMKGCNVYSIMFLEMFEKKEGLLPMIPGGKSYKNVQSPEECAQRCKQYEGFTCRGFEHCKTKKSCVLHHRHALDLSKEEVGVGNADCTHYSAKFIADYTDMGNLKLNDGIFKQNLGSTPEECAKACSEQMKNCKSFNFCPASAVGGSDSSCTLSTKSPLDKGIDPVAAENCHLYLKKSDVEIEGWEKFKLDVTDSKKKANTAGVVIGTLVFGLFIGVAIAFGYSYYRSRKGGDGLNVRFVKS